MGFGENLLPSFKVYAEQVIKNAQAMAAALTDLGYQIVSGGTDNHLMLIDLRNKGITGKEAQEALDLAGITVNKNAVPFDDKSPLITSGFRMGTPALTTRGMKETEMKAIAQLIDRALQERASGSALAAISRDVKQLCSGFPLYAELVKG